VAFLLSNSLSNGFFTNQSAVVIIHNEIISGVMGIFLWSLSIDFPV